MPNSYRALCSDFYLNSRLSVRMELPDNREPVLELFERVRRGYPGMSSFRRYKDELALESTQDAVPHRWMAIRKSSVRAGVVNPSDEEQMYALHRTVAEVSPYYLSISPLDLESIELLWGFDLSAKGNHDEIVANAVLSGSPLASLIDSDGLSMRECQPSMSMTLGSGDERIEASFEVKTRSGDASLSGEREEPISLYVTMRMGDPVKDLKELPGKFDVLAERGRGVVDGLVLPNVLMPLREEIGSRSF